MNSFLDKQIKDAKINFNYFFMKMINKIFKCLILIACILLINEIFDILAINIITLLYTIYSIFKIFQIIDEYSYILNEIKNTFNKVDFNFILDTDIIKKDLLNLVVKYGK